VAIANWQGWLLPWQKVFLPGQWKKLVKTGKNWQKLQNAVYVTAVRS
jgi:hypothetical protein